MLSVSLDLPRLVSELYYTSFSLKKMISQFNIKVVASLVNCLQKQNFLFCACAVSEYQGVPYLYRNCQ